MSELTPTRSVLIALVEERRALHEGYVFLDEKCLLLAGAIMTELRNHEAAQQTVGALRERAARALAEGVMSLGLEALECYPSLSPGSLQLDIGQHELLGVPLRSARLIVPAALQDPASPGTSAEAEAVRAAFAALLAQLAALAATSGNLERLADEYRRTVRRARALQDVLLPELDRNVHEIDTALEEIEREEAGWLRRPRDGYFLALDEGAIPPLPRL